MKLSVKSDYAARAVLGLARRYATGAALRVEDLAVEAGHPWQLPGPDPYRAQSAGHRSLVCVARKGAICWQGHLRKSPWAMFCGQFMGDL
jgi:hypothetical protein